MSDPEKDLESMTGMEINARLNELINESLETNHLILQVERSMAKDALTVRDAFLVQAERMEEISELHSVIARMTADRTGDLISLEFNLVPNDPDVDAEFDEDDDTDE